MKPSRLALASLAMALAAGPVLGQQTRPAPDASAVPEPIQIGKEAPGFSLPDPTGTAHSPSELRDKKDLVLVFFRGSW